MKYLLHIGTFYNKVKMYVDMSVTNILNTDI